MAGLIAPRRAPALVPAQQQLAGSQIAHPPGPAEGWDANEPAGLEVLEPAAEMTVLVGGLRALDANSRHAPHGVFTAVCAGFARSI